MTRPSRILALALGLTASCSGYAATFASTNDASAWQVSTNLTGIDGSFSSFSTANFRPAVPITGRVSDGTNWISNISSGSNASSVRNWVFFVFRQTFTLTATEAANGDLPFEWAADDSGEGFADRGTWTPKYSLNGAALRNGSWATGSTYDLSPTVDLKSGFVVGSNTLDFYVEGNGITDGFSLKTTGFVTGVPEPGTYGLMLVGLTVVSCMTRHRIKSRPDQQVDSAARIADSGHGRV